LTEYELHPLCTLFPRLTGAEFDALRDDIQANGLRQPIVLHEGRILDGGNRYRACIEAGVTPTFVEFAGGNLVAFVLSANLRRRHMSAGQQAAIVASAQDWAKAQAAGSNQHRAKSAAGPATLPEHLDRAKSAAGPATLPEHLATVSQRAAESGASERTQRMADKVAKADPELARRVAHGEVSLPKALAKVEGKLAPTRAADPEPWDDEGAPSIEELMATEKAAAADLAAMTQIFEADDRLAEARSIIKRQQAVIDQLQWRVNGLVNENAELIRMVKSLRRRAEKDAA
jgi:ParB-like chromosome segregation protein Spo0J